MGRTMQTSRASLSSSTASAHAPDEGSVLRIALGEGCAYARVLPDSRIAIYDPLACEGIGVMVSDICGAAIHWKLPVSASSLCSGRWPVVGHRALEPALAAPVSHFAWNRLTGEFEIHRVAGRAQQRRVWTAQHVEERIRDYLAGCTAPCARELESVW